MRRRKTFVAGAIAIAVLVAVAATKAPFGLGGQTGASAGRSAQQSTVPQSRPSSAPATVALDRFEGGGASFDYPANWRFLAAYVNPTFPLLYGPVLGVGSWAFVCAEGGCGPQMRATPNGVIVQFSTLGGHLSGNPTSAPDAMQLANGFTAQNLTDTDTKSIWLVLPPTQDSPIAGLGPTTIEADYGSGDVQVARSEVRSLILSLHFGPQFDLPLASPDRPGATAMPSSASGSPLPTGGISRDKAIEIAKTFSVLPAVVSTEVGSIGDLYPDFLPTGIGAPTRLVWMVTLASTVRICSGALSNQSCSVPNTRFFLDYRTGDWLLATG